MPVDSLPAFIRLMANHGPCYTEPRISAACIPICNSSHDPSPLVLATRALEPLELKGYRVPYTCHRKERKQFFIPSLSLG